MSSGFSTAHSHSLETVRLDIMEGLHAAIRDRTHALRTPVIATVDETGAPQARVMILRAFDEKSMILRLFTDGRSPKVRQLRACPKAQAVFYDPAHKVHIRASGLVRLHNQSGLTETLWDGLPDYGRGDYLTRQPPGAQINDPTDGWQRETDFGTQNFTVIELTIFEIDWLKLSASGHRRAQLLWREGQCEGRWVTP